MFALFVVFAAYVTVSESTTLVTELTTVETEKDALPIILFLIIGVLLIPMFIIIPICIWLMLQYRYLSPFSALFAICLVNLFHSGCSLHIL